MLKEDIFRSLLLPAELKPGPVSSPALPTNGTHSPLRPRASTRDLCSVGTVSFRVPAEDRGHPGRTPPERARAEGTREGAWLTPGPGLHKALSTKYRGPGHGADSAVLSKPEHHACSPACWTRSLAEEAQLGLQRCRKYSCPWCCRAGARTSSDT